jgi:heme/copper-type cytochrome/quinol oxidase subunit 3
MLGQTILAANNFGAGDLIENASAGASLVAEGFNDLWQQTLTGGLYASLCKVGVLFAVATLALFMVQWGKQMINDEEQRAFSELIWPLIVTVLLANNGSLLANSTLALREYINSVNNYILEYTAADADLRAAYQQALGQAALETRN